MIRAARAAGVKIIWDLCHYGWPDHLDVWSGEFVDEFARFSRAAARLLREESDDVPVYCPINEISYLAWAGGEAGRMNPCGTGRGDELKRQLVRACVASIHAIRDVEPRARFMVSEPLIHVAAGAPSAQTAAESYRLAQFEAHEMLVGRLAPELGGSAACLDIIGANFYSDNQWYLNGSTIPLGHHAYRPLREMLVEVYKRYERPLLISETGAEGAARPYWLNHVCCEARHAAARGAAIAGLCLYPILDYRGWDNDRICSAGLWSMPTDSGRRTVDDDLLDELRRQMLLERSHARDTSNAR
jgi:beta-glucosidase/6-phospho-beta-glucosidase/beta-galactosidase